MSTMICVFNGGLEEDEASKFTAKIWFRDINIASPNMVCIHIIKEPSELRSNHSLLSVHKCKHMCFGIYVGYAPDNASWHLNWTMTYDS